MQTYHRKFSMTRKLMLAGAVLLIGACASYPFSTAQLEQARGDYVRAQTDPTVARYAPAELQVASDALARANTAAGGGESPATVDSLAFQTMQKVNLAREVASRRSADADVASAAAARDQMRLDQIAMDANQARIKAEEAERLAKAARNAAELATQQRNIAQMNESQAQRQVAEASARNLRLQTQLEDLAAKQTDRGHVITLGDTLFNADTADLNSNGFRVLLRLATVLQQNPARTVVVEGYTDSTGTARHSQELSEQRALSVRNALVDLGVGRDRIDSRGLGAAFPLAPNDTAFNRQLNRRVEIILSNDRGLISAR